MASLLPSTMSCRGLAARCLWQRAHRAAPRAIRSAHPSHHRTMHACAPPCHAPCAALRCAALRSMGFHACMHGVRWVHPSRPLPVAQPGGSVRTHSQRGKPPCPHMHTCMLRKNHHCVHDKHVLHGSDRGLGWQAQAGASPTLYRVQIIIHNFLVPHETQPSFIARGPCKPPSEWGVDHSRSGCWLIIYSSRLIPSRDYSYMHVMCSSIGHA